MPKILKYRRVNLFSINFLMALSLFSLGNYGFANTLRVKSTASQSTKSKKINGMALIKGDTFPMGTQTNEIPTLQKVFEINRAELFLEETPQHSVTISSFYIDKFEVTNAQFKKFIAKYPKWSVEQIPAKFHNGDYLKHWSSNTYPKEKANHPVVYISWYAAVAFCQSLGKRLPTEAEWEYAARGGLKNKAFPWGDAPVDKTKANYYLSNLKTTTPVGSYPANGYGLFDMSGNVWEYLADEWKLYSADPQTNPVAGGNLFLDKSFYDITTRRVLRGGSWGGAPVNLRVAYRDSHLPNNAKDFVGFRCAKSASK